jgi:hypothetical protein
MSEIIIRWNQIHSKGNEVSDDTILNTQQFVDDHIYSSDPDYYTRCKNL